MGAADVLLGAVRVRRPCGNLAVRCRDKVALGDPKAVILPPLCVPRSSSIKTLTADSVA